MAPLLRPQTLGTWTDTQENGMYPALALGSPSGPPVPLHTGRCCDIVHRGKGHWLPAPRLPKPPQSRSSSVQRRKGQWQEGRSLWGQGGHFSQCCPGALDTRTERTHAHTHTSHMPQLHTQSGPSWSYSITQPRHTDPRDTNNRAVGDIQGHMAQKHQAALAHKHDPTHKIPVRAM